MMWLILAGWWLSIFWVVAAWVCVLFNVTESVGLRMLSRIQYVVALKAPQPACLDLADDTIWSIEQKATPQRPIVLRCVYALLIGWWLSLAWALLAWSQSIRLQNGSNSVVMFMRLPAIVTLRRY